MKYIGGRTYNAVKDASTNMKDMIKSRMCDRCGETMKEIQPCHLKCFNCGAEMDCSEKGLVW